MGRKHVEVHKSIRKRLSGAAARLPDTVVNAHVDEVRRIRRDQSIWPALPTLPKWSHVPLQLVLQLVIWFSAAALAEKIRFWPTMALIVTATVAWVVWLRHAGKGFDEQVAARIKATNGRAELCVTCGYDLRHIQSDVCPECGVSVWVEPPGAAATAALAATIRPNRDNRFHPKLVELHPTVAGGVRTQIELKNKDDVDGGSRVMLIMMGVLTFAAACALIYHATPFWMITGISILLTSLFAITFHFHRHHHNRLTRKYLNANRPHLPCWFCGTKMTASICTACKARNLTRDEVANSAV